MRPAVDSATVRRQVSELRAATDRLLTAVERGERAEIRAMAWAVESEAEGIAETARTLQRPRH